MKGGFYGLMGKQISLILIALVCSTILIWAWEKTPLLSPLLPPEDRLLQLSPETLLRVPTALKPHISSVTEKEVVNEHHEEISPGIEKSKTDVIATPFEEKGDVSEREMAKKQEERKHSPEVVSENNVHVEERACNYAKGKWVVDDSRPLYSGFGCKQWLSAMWACRLTQRTDFAYEKLRWQPNNCAMEEFTASNFLERMQHKTIAFVGDSLGRQQFQSLMCMATGGKEMSDVLDVGKEYGLVKAKGSIRPDGWAYRFPRTNTTILYYWSASLADLEPLDITNRLTDYAMHLDRPPAFLRRFLPKFNVLVLNTGHHWNRGKFTANRWVMHVGGVPNIDRKIADIGGAKNFTIYSIVHWVDSELLKYPGLKAFYRTISPRHFFNGDWNTGGTCDNTTPSLQEVLQDESSDPVAAGAVKGTKVTLTDITALSQLRDEGHISRYSIRATPGMQDCLHWCLPGVPDTWNEILFAQV
ncbi:protein trichome birefringence-like 16 isoform X3 [Rhododendron vialii]|uniref:protein trichome birefringence-like 16 isoform X3 n=1 Tax=Rhododendron vialii TaxID=182163 RepID=UPI00265F5505|nr:protein trichome birefringence-like 16 isoform X3 [Rhododendron vialii]